MSLLAPLLRPKRPPSSTIVSPPSTPVACRNPRRQFNGKEHVQTTRAYVGDDRRPTSALSSKSRSAEHTFEHLFISSLVAAASCPRHQEYSPASGTAVRRQKISLARRPSHHIHQRCLSSQSQKRSKSIGPPKSPASPASSASPHISRDEYKKLVNTYPSFGDEVEPAHSGRPDREHFPLAPRLVVTPFQELGLVRGAREVVPPEDQQHRLELRQLETLVFKPLGTISHDRLWDMYKKLRPPRPRYIDDAIFSRFFRQLQWTQFKNSEITMQRYFTLLDECIAEKVKVSRAVWNGAIDLSGRWIRRASSSEIKTAVETWMRMEKAGYRASHVTFNILFNIAVRAGRYALADTISAELRARNLRLDRYFRASLIFYAGVRRDGDAVRQAFRDFVDGGDTVDTTVMNSVILSLIRAGEAAAAENVFQRMKSLHEAKEGAAAIRHWRKRKELGQVLDETGRLLQKEKKSHESSFFGAVFSSEGRREQIQKATPIAPDASTYAILIKYHARTSGDLDRIRELLQEMAQHDFNVHGSVYTHILMGFEIHGGYAFSAWSRTSLEEFWTDIVTASTTASVSSLEVDLPIEEVDAGDEDDRGDLLGAMFHESRAKDARQKWAALVKEQSNKAPISELERPTYIARGLALAAVHAFYKCTGSKRMLEVWQEILALWQNAPTEDVERVQRAVDDMVEHDSIYIKDQ